MQERIVHSYKGLLIVESRTTKMTRKTPFSGKAKKQQLQEKRERHRRRQEAESSDDERQVSDATGASTQVPPAPVKSGRGDLRTVFQAEPESAINARKKDAMRVLSYAPDRGNSQSIYAYGLQEVTNQPPILLKPRWSHDMSPEDLVQAEDQEYQEWLHQIEELAEERGLHINLFERNIEVWRQLWRTIERSDVLVHLADARCPVLHLSDRLIEYIRSAFPDKRVIIVLTKADIVPADRVDHWRAFIQGRYGDQIPVFSYDKEQAGTVNAEFLRLIGGVSQTIDFRTRDLVRHEDEDTLTIGFVGEPNVGKSSLLNSLFDRKLVSVSPTPGHTKHLQTHYFPHPELILSSNEVKRVVVCDCPGVVFPRLGVPFALQVLFGSYPIAQTREPFSAIRFISENCLPPLDDVYGLRPVEEDDDEWTPYTLCESYAKLRGFHIKGGKFDVHRAANQLLRDTLNGKKVVLSFPAPGSPPSVDATE